MVAVVGMLSPKISFIKEGLKTTTPSSLNSVPVCPLSTQARGILNSMVKAASTVLFPNCEVPRPVMHSPRRELFSTILILPQRSPRYPRLTTLQPPLNLLQKTPPPNSFQSRTLEWRNSW